MWCITGLRVCTRKSVLTSQLSGRHWWLNNQSFPRSWDNKSIKKGSNICEKLFNTHDPLWPLYSRSPSSFSLTHLKEIFLESYVLSSDLLSPSNRMCPLTESVHLLTWNVRSQISSLTSHFPPRHSSLGRVDWPKYTDPSTWRRPYVRVTLAWNWVSLAWTGLGRVEW